MPKAKQIKNLSDLKPDTRNANKGTQRGGGLLESSLQNYGAGRSVLVDRNGNLIAGNKTTEAAVSVGLDDDVILVPSDGKKLVVVQRTDLDINDKAARELAINDNRISEINLDWDVEQLAGLADDGVEFGDLWSGDELAKLLDNKETFDFLKSNGNTEAESSEPAESGAGEAFYPLSIVLTRADKNRWDKYKEAVGMKSDQTAFTKLLEEVVQ